jgi:hypothetical protein
MTHRQVVGVAVQWAVHGLANLYRLAVVPALHQKTSARRFLTAIADAGLGRAALLQALPPSSYPQGIIDPADMPKLLAMIRGNEPSAPALLLAMRQLVEAAASACGTAASSITTTLRRKWFTVRR